GSVVASQVADGISPPAVLMRWSEVTLLNMPVPEWETSVRSSHGPPIPVGDGACALGIATTELPSFEVNVAVGGSECECVCMPITALVSQSSIFASSATD